MNVEHLHAVAVALREELDETGAVATVRQLRDALQRQITEPQNAAHQQQVSEIYERLRLDLTAAPSSSYSPSWQQTLEDLGVWELIGTRLRDRIVYAFQQNQVTPSIAFDQLET